MKHVSMAIAAAVLAGTATAQDAPPAAPVPPVAPPPPATAPAEPAPVPGGIQDERERNSYGLGSFLGNQERTNAQSGLIDRTLNADEVLAGVKAVLDRSHSSEYAAGVAIGSQILRSGLDIDPEVLLGAMKETINGEQGRLTSEEVGIVMRDIQKKINELRTVKVKEEADRNLKEAEAFLEANRGQDGVVTTASGLQYRLAAAGDGNAPGETDILTLQLTGKLADGTEFETTPADKPVKRAMGVLPKGLQEGLQLLKPGGKATFWIPPALGYGERGQGRKVKSNAALVYEVELIAAEPAPPKPPKPVSAVTPPVAVDIPPAPPKEGAAQNPPAAVTPPVQVPPAPPKQ